MSIPHTYRDKHGTYYVRYVIRTQARAHLQTAKKDVRKSLRTKSSATAKIRSRVFLAELDRLLGEFELSGYRDAAYYLHLITAFDPFGNQVSIERPDAAEEAKIFIELQRAWAQVPEGKEMLEARKAAFEADLLRRDPVRQAEDHSVAEVIDVFLRDKRASLSNQPLNELRSGLELFRHFMGDEPFNRLTKEKLREFRTLVPKLPARISVNKTLKDLPIDEVVRIAKKNNFERIAARTVEVKIAAVRQLVKWAFESADFLDEDISGPLERKYVNVKDNKGTINYIAFETFHLKNLLGSYLYSGDIPKRMRVINPARFWVPMIALFSGARLEEICQLYMQDIVFEDGVQIFRFTPEDDEDIGKEVNFKTDSSHRRVPIHNRLIEMGFGDYLEELRQRGESRLFPDIDNNNIKEKFGFSISKWFGDTMSKSIGYKKKSKYCFHSFRKNFIQRLQNTSGVTREVRKALVGHSIGGGDVHEVYEGNYDVHILKQAIDLLEYPELDFRHVSWADFKARVARWEACKEK